MAEKRSEKVNNKHVLSTTLLLALVALLAATAASLAWFTISDSTRVNSMIMDVTAGLALRIDRVEHRHFEDYVQHMSIPLEEQPLLPVTSKDGKSFMLENGTLVNGPKGYYAEFELHFMGTMDMWVHMTSTHAQDKKDGTAMWSKENSRADQALRLALVWEDGAFLYNPRTDDISGWTEKNKLFFLPAETDKKVMLRIWLEGTDPNCKNDLKGIEYAINLKFEGTDTNNQRLQ